jgi:hypothetical protein
MNKDKENLIKLLKEPYKIKMEIKKIGEKFS